MKYLSILFLILACISYAINQLWYHGKLIWSHEGIGFWGRASDKRKYKPYLRGHTTYMPAPNTWYYRTFKIKYQERFPLSATMLVSFTDGLHLNQHFFIGFFIMAIVTYQPLLQIGWMISGYIGLWLLVFNICYRKLSK